MFYRIFLYKMFASSIFIFTFATGNKKSDVRIYKCANCHTAEKHIIERHMSYLSN